MKNILFFLFVGLITFTSCESDSTTEDLRTINDFSGTYSGILDSDDDDNMDQLLIVNITNNNDGTYAVDLLNDENDIVFRTSALQDGDQLNFDWKLVQTLTEETPLELKYVLTYVDNRTLDMEMRHKYQFEVDEFLSSSRLIKD